MTLSISSVQSVGLAAGSNELDVGVAICRPFGTFPSICENGLPNSAGHFRSYDR
jgi:hypothetical protein